MTASVRPAGHEVWKRFSFQGSARSRTPPHLVFQSQASAAAQSATQSAASCAYVAPRWKGLMIRTPAMVWPGLRSSVINSSQPAPAAAATTRASRSDNCAEARNARPALRRAWVLSITSKRLQARIVTRSKGEGREETNPPRRARKAQTLTSAIQTTVARSPWQALVSPAPGKGPPPDRGATGRQVPGLIARRHRWECRPWDTSSRRYAASEAQPPQRSCARSKPYSLREKPRDCGRRPDRA